MLPWRRKKEQPKKKQGAGGSGERVGVDRRSWTGVGKPGNLELGRGLA